MSCHSSQTELNGILTYAYLKNPARGRNARLRKSIDRRIMYGDRISRKSTQYMNYLSTLLVSFSIANFSRPTEEFQSDAVTAPFSVLPHTH